MLRNSIWFQDIFRAAGKVLSFRLVYDRESGKPKGYGFCEYEDQETALSAMRNLNGFEFGGRQLRVDSAAADKGEIVCRVFLASAEIFLLEMRNVHFPPILIVGISVWRINSAAKNDLGKFANFGQFF